MRERCLRNLRLQASLSHNSGYAPVLSIPLNFKGSYLPCVFSHAKVWSWRIMRGTLLLTLARFTLFQTQYRDATPRHAPRPDPRWPLLRGRGGEGRWQVVAGVEGDRAYCDGLRLPCLMMPTPYATLLLSRMLVVGNRRRRHLSGKYAMQ